MLHKGLIDGKWGSMSFIEQMANIGSEVSRTANWMQKENTAYAEKAFFRCLELIDITLQHVTRASQRKEICRLRENICSIYVAQDLKELHQLNSYFTHFAIAYNLHKTTSDYLDLHGG